MFSSPSPSTSRGLTGISGISPTGVFFIASTASRDVSYATAFRQASIVIGLLLCVVFLKEKPGGYRVAGTLIIFVGLVMVALG